MDESIRHLQSQVQQAINQSFEEAKVHLAIRDSHLLKACEYALLNGGKRLRPLLLTMVGQMLGANAKDLATAALALECIHSYSLVHDDLPAMDNDDLRRGKPTCHIQFDEATAILAGDALQTLAFELLSDDSALTVSVQKQLAVIKVLSRASGINGMCLGQSLDLLATDKIQSVDALSDMHQLKTGALISAAVSIGALLAPSLKQSDLGALDQFGRSIGLAFQIQDDILDVVSDTKTLGKPQGSDTDANKSTFVSILGIEGAKKALQDNHTQALQALDQLDYNTEQLRSFTDFMVSRTF